MNSGKIKKRTRQKFAESSDLMFMLFFFYRTTAIAILTRTAIFNAAIDDDSRTAENQNTQYYSCHSFTSLISSIVIAGVCLTGFLTMK